MRFPEILDFQDRQFLSAIADICLLLHPTHIADPTTFPPPNQQTELLYHRYTNPSKIDIFLIDMLFRGYIHFMDMQEVLGSDLALNEILRMNDQG